MYNFTLQEHKNRKEVILLFDTTNIPTQVQLKPIFHLVPSNNFKKYKLDELYPYRCNQ